MAASCPTSSYASSSTSSDPVLFRIRTLHPCTSLRKLRTALPASPPTALQIATPATSPSLTDSAASPSFSPFLSPSNDNVDGQQLARRTIRRVKSVLETEQEAERILVGELLISGVVEPRPRAGPACGSIEEVLGGRA